MIGTTLRRLRAPALGVLIGLSAFGCSSGTDADSAVLGAEETAVETTSAPETTAAPETTSAPETTAALETTEAPTTTEALSEAELDSQTLETFIGAIDDQDYGTVLGLLHPDYASSIQADTGNTWSAFWVFQTAFDYDGLGPITCEPGAAVISCTQLVNDRLARTMGYEFTTTLSATFEDGLIRTAAISSSDEPFFIPLLIWASVQPDSPCSPASPAYAPFTEEELATSRAKQLSEFDLEEPVVAGVVGCVNFMVDNVEAFAAMPDSPPLPTA